MFFILFVLAGLNILANFGEFFLPMHILSTIEKYFCEPYFQAEHFMATDVEWDPTGRYVATGVSWWGHKVDNAFWIWNFQVENNALQSRSGKVTCKLDTKLSKYVEVSSRELELHFQRAHLITQ